MKLNTHHITERVSEIINQAVTESLFKLDDQDTLLACRCHIASAMDTLKERDVITGYNINIEIVENNIKGNVLFSPSNVTTSFMATVDSAVNNIEVSSFDMAMKGV